MYIKKQRLSTPGPTPLYPPAMHAMMGSDIHHRTEDFRHVYRACISGLKQVMGTTHDVLLFSSSGTGAMDAAVSNLFSKGDKVIVCIAGKFGERWLEIVKAYGLEPIVLTVPYGEAVSPRELEEALARESDLRGVFVQASESSTGAAHDVRAMGAAVANTDAIFVVDAITGLGTMPLDIDAWGLDVVISGSQKAFMVPPGLAFLSISPKAWRFAETSTLPHYYFNLKKEKKSGDGGESSWTPAIALILALKEALDYINGIGIDKVVANAQMLAAATRAAVQAMGLELFTPKSPGAAVTAVKPPSGMDSSVIAKEFRDRFGTVIANGQGSMKGQLFRIAHIGYFDFLDLFSTLAALEIILNANGFPVKYGTGVAVAQEFLAKATITPKVPTMV
jgi:aspartate aminotransferase-like enzyme